ncbi:PucR family transcriptional regulator [Butyrivibrio sp. WCD3002]|jgi:carbohydrate diacid regulator|uniref:PucR family transcriptional regulator n=1 Tax=Butyrivibrio sp. WCD3002 TaxID=1280676 RepID=UPI00040CBCA0|nr:helix-turn-helix domain-containing protein [Butyrivibrio sp. WCD3002]
MISAQIIQTSIDELSAITRVQLSVLDLNGKIVAATAEAPSFDSAFISDFAGSAVDSQVIGGVHLLKIFDEGELLYILIASGQGEDAYMVGKICVSQLQNLIIAYKEKYDRNNFFQNLLLDNLLLIDIYNRAKKLRIDVNVPRVIILVETRAERDSGAAELLSSMFTSQAGDYVTAVDENSVILVKSVKAGESYEDIDDIANTIVDMMNTEAMLDVRVSYGTIVGEIKDLSKSYKEAKMALDVGKIFYAERHVTAYNTLGIGRLIYQLPINLCRIFIDEIFGDREVPENLDEETLNTVNKFFENNLNVSETSRQLFVHRNTLVYRIEKLQKATGLDVRTFDEALTFKIAMMVLNYMRYVDKSDF